MASATGTVLQTLVKRPPSQVLEDSTACTRVSPITLVELCPSHSILVGARMVTGVSLSLL